MIYIHIVHSQNHQRSKWSKNKSTRLQYDKSVLQIKNKETQRMYLYQCSVICTMNYVLKQKYFKKQNCAQVKLNKVWTKLSRKLKYSRDLHSLYFNLKAYSMWSITKSCTTWVDCLQNKQETSLNFILT